MTKIPTVREMEELLLRDSKTADLIDGRNAKSKSPDTKLTADQVRHEVSVFARVLINIYCGWPFHNEVLKRKILKTLVDIHRNTKDMTSAELLEQLRPAIEIIPDNHINLRMLGYDMGVRTTLRKPRPNVGKNIASGKKFHTEQRSDIGIIAVPTLSGWTDDEQQIFEEQWRTILPRSEILIIDLRGNGGGNSKPLSDMADYILGDENFPFARRQYIRNNPDANAVKKLYRQSIGTKFNIKSTTDPIIYEDNSNDDILPKFDATRAGFNGPIYILIDSGVMSSGELICTLLRNHPKAKFIGTNTRGGEVYGYNYAYILLPHSHIRFNVGCVYRELFTENFELNGYEPDIKCLDGTDAFAVVMAEIEKGRTMQTPILER
ncbi:MAG: hypothetical protein J6J82_03880 [Alphaproteobacteria bacterium]|nr:hypothetical protein [Alphaproteobacteria bacterium]